MYSPVVLTKSDIEKDVDFYPINSKRNVPLTIVHSRMKTWLHILPGNQIISDRPRPIAGQHRPEYKPKLNVMQDRWRPSTVWCWNLACRVRIFEAPVFVQPLEFVRVRSAHILVGLCRKLARNFPLSSFPTNPRDMNWLKSHIQHAQTLTWKHKHTHKRTNIGHVHPLRKCNTWVVRYKKEAASGDACQDRLGIDKTKWMRWTS